MKAEEHLTTKELRGLNCDDLEFAPWLDVRRHLLACADCRSTMAFPNLSNVHAAVFLEDEELSTSSVSIAPTPFVASLREFFASRRPVLAGLYSVLLIAFFGLVVVRLFNTEDGRITARSVMRPQSTSAELEGAFNEKEIFEPPISLKGQVDRSRRPSAARVAVHSHISETRGSRNFCSEHTAVYGEVIVTKTDIRLKWGKVPGAVKYNSYVSDLEENLVDELESVDETEHTIRGPLTPETKYRWKLLTTFKDGRTVTNLMQTFSGSGTVDGPKKDGKGRASVSDVRCVNEK